MIKGHYDLFVTNCGILKCREINWSPISFYLLQASSKSPEVDLDSKESALKVLSSLVKGVVLRAAAGCIF